MKRNTLTAWLLGIILIFSATSCFNGPIVKGSKNYITKKENLEHFNDINMSGSANIIYQQDSSSRIEIYGSDNIVELLETKVNGKTLNIKFKNNVNIIDKGKLEIKVFSPDLNGLTLNGSGGILFANGIHTEGDLKVTINGSVPEDSDRIPRVPPYSGYCYRITCLPVRVFHSLRMNFPEHSS